MIAKYSSVVLLRKQTQWEHSIHKHTVKLYGHRNLNRVVKYIAFGVSSGNNLWNSHQAEQMLLTKIKSHPPFIISP